MSLRELQDALLLRENQLQTLSYHQACLLESLAWEERTRAFHWERQEVERHLQLAAQEQWVKEQQAVLLAREKQLITREQALRKEEAKVRAMAEAVQEEATILAAIREQLASRFAAAVEREKEMEEKSAEAERIRVEQQDHLKQQQVAKESESELEKDQAEKETVPPCGHDHLRRLYDTTLVCEQSPSAANRSRGTAEYIVQIRPSSAASAAPALDRDEAADSFSISVTLPITPSFVAGTIGRNDDWRSLHDRAAGASYLRGRVWCDPSTLSTHNPTDAEYWSNVVDGDGDPQVARLLLWRFESTGRVVQKASAAEGVEGELSGWLHVEDMTIFARMRGNHRHDNDNDGDQRNEAAGATVRSCRRWSLPLSFPMNKQELLVACLPVDAHKALLLCYPNGSVALATSRPNDNNEEKGDSEGPSSGSIVQTLTACRCVVRTPRNNNYEGTTTLSAKKNHHNVDDRLFSVHRPSIATVCVWPLFEDGSGDAAYITMIDHDDASRLCVVSVDEDAVQLEGHVGGVLPAAATTHPAPHSTTAPSSSGVLSPLALEGLLPFSGEVLLVWSAHAVWAVRVGLEGLSWTLLEAASSSLAAAAAATTATEVETTLAQQQRRRIRSVAIAEGCTDEEHICLVVHWEG